MAKKKIVIIEDEAQQALQLRRVLESANKRKQFGSDVAILPERRDAFPSMEDFAKSPDGEEHDLCGVIIADLFLAEMVVDPVSSFHQLMFSLFESPTDFSLVCGRLGVLKKIVERYKHAHVEVYTYFPTYFTGQNERVREDGFLHKHLKSKTIIALAETRKDDFEGFLREHPNAASGVPAAANLLQTLALYEALQDRMQGIFWPRNSSEHLTEAPCKPMQERRPSDVSSGQSVSPASSVSYTEKKDDISESNRKLVEKIVGVMNAPEVDQ